MKPFSIPKPKVKSLSENKILPISVDIRNGIAILDSFSFMTGDVGCSYINAQFFMDGKIFSIENNRVVCTIRLPDNSIKDIVCTDKVGHTLSVLVDSAIEGEYIYEFKIYSEGKILGTNTSSYSVLGSI